jgi:hypothetical protein
VEADMLWVLGGASAQASASGRTLSVGFPALQAWEGVDFEAVQGRWYVDEDYLPGPSAVRTTGPGRQVESTPAYVLKLYSPPGYGVLAPYALANALLGHFPPLLALFPSTGDVVRVRGDVAPYRSQLMTLNGFSLITVTLPLRLRTVNSI